MMLGKTAAVVVRKGALQTDAKPDYSNGNILLREMAAEVILSILPEDAVVVSTTGKLSREIFEIRERRGEGHQRDFLTVGSMGHASMIALGIAREKPDRPVWCLDGDGAFLMHMGTLPVIANSGVKNFVHVVIDNGAHETVGGMPVCSGTLKLGAVALASGYKQAMEISTKEELEQQVFSLCSGSLSGPSLLAVRCACGAREDLGRPTTTPIQNRDAFMSFLK
jgi:phosphonopyruvate decarboxylase